MVDGYSMSIRVWSQQLRSVTAKNSRIAEDLQAAMKPQIVLSHLKTMARCRDVQQTLVILRCNWRKKHLQCKSFYQQGNGSFRITEEERISSLFVFKTCYEIPR